MFLFIAAVAARREPLLLKGRLDGGEERTLPAGRLKDGSVPSSHKGRSVPPSNDASPEGGVSSSKDGSVPSSKDGSVFFSKDASPYLRSDPSLQDA